MSLSPNEFIVEGKMIKLQRLLSSGGYGSVHCGLLNDRTPVAIKKQKFGRRATEEWKYLMSCKSDYIIEGYFHFFRHNNEFMVMEKAETDVYIYINQIGAVTDPGIFAAIAWQIITGLSVIHQMGLIHRDIKPQNILVCGQYFKICDFGFAIEVNCTRKLDEGTRSTMAPEVMTEQNYDTKADIWGLGVLLYFIRTAAYPFNIGIRRIDVLIDIVKKVKLTGTFEIQVKEYLKYHQIPYATETTIFDDKVMYYRHKNVITICLEPDPSKRVSAEQLRHHIIFRELRDEDFDKIPFYVPRME